MKIAVFGSGYVGLVTAVCLADVGNSVVGVDTDLKKIQSLNEGVPCIYEFNLAEALKKNIQNGHLFFTNNPREAIEQAEVIFIAVGTPSENSGAINMVYVDEVSATLGQFINEYKVIVNKSTVPVGSAERVQGIIQKQLALRKMQISFDVISNPEFLKEGSAIADCMRPDRIIIGTDSTRALDLMKILYAPFNRQHDRIIQMSARSAELTKYAANAMLATKISFMNEISQIAEKVGADIEDVRIGIGADQRIGYHFIYAGCGYGGSCFPKDVQGLVTMGQELEYDPMLLRTVHLVNQKQKQVLFQKIFGFYRKNLKRKVIALWGLSFKPNTDDVREAPSRVLMEALWDAGAIVKAYDPKGADNIARIYGSRNDLILCANKEAAIENADALAIVTEWAEFKSPDFKMLAECLSDRVIFDGRNLYDPKILEGYSLRYYGIGRGAVLY